MRLAPILIQPHSKESDSSRRVPQPVVGIGLHGDVTRSTIRKMNTAAKLLLAMRSNPLDWQLAQLQTVARQHGIDWRHDGTSHCVFVRPDGKTLPVPARRPIKPIYIKKFLELVEGA